MFYKNRMKERLHNSVVKISKVNLHFGDDSTGIEGLLTNQSLTKVFLTCFYEVETYGVSCLPSLLKRRLRTGVTICNKVSYKLNGHEKSNANVPTVHPGSVEYRVFVVF